MSLEQPDTKIFFEEFPEFKQFWVYLVEDGQTCPGLGVGRTEKGALGRAKRKLTKMLKQIDKWERELDNE